MKARPNTELMLSGDGRAGNPPRLVGHEQPVEVDDSVLWSRARTGDSEAFGMLFERHARTIYHFCFRRVGDWATAEDLVSIVFLQAWRRLDKPLPRGKELPWLFGIATNVVRNRRRAERRHAAALRRVPKPSPEPSFADDRDQEVFALCAWSELSYEDAAIALRIPVGTVRSRLSRARARLRELHPAIGHDGERMQMTKEAVEP